MYFDQKTALVEIIFWALKQKLYAHKAAKVFFKPIFDMFAPKTAISCQNQLLDFKFLPSLTPFAGSLKFANISHLHLITFGYSNEKFPSDMLFIKQISYLRMSL